MGILLRQSANNVSGGYGFFICSDNGYWSVSRYDPNTGNPIVLTDGYVPVQSSYDVKAVADGAKETLSIDDKLVATVTDTTFLTTDHVTLAAGATNESGPVAFSNFYIHPVALTQYGLMGAPGADRGRDTEDTEALRARRATEKTIKPFVALRVAHSAFRALHVPPLAHRVVTSWLHPC